MVILDGNKVIEIKKMGVNKGKAITNWLKNEYDFILAFGDDWTDEDMFVVLPDHAYSIKVGFRPSQAKYNLASEKEVITLLEKIRGK